MIAPPFPRTEAELVDWSVYADALMRDGDPRGEVIAKELAASAVPPKKLVPPPAIAVPHARATWTLGHLRDLWIEPKHHDHELDRAQLEALIALLESPDAAQLETLLIISHWSALPLLRRVFAVLPKRCTRVIARQPQIYATAGTDMGVIASLMPDHVTELALSWNWMTNLEAAIDDRFSVLDLPAIREQDVAPVVAGLARTSRVRVRVQQLEPIHERVVTFDGPGFLATTKRHATAILPRSRWDLQQSHGVLPIRAQLNRSLPTAYTVQDHVTTLSATIGGNHLIHRGGTWSLRAEFDNVFSVDGVELEADHAAKLHDGVLIRMNRTVATFVTHGLQERLRSIA